MMSPERSPISIRLHSPNPKNYDYALMEYNILMYQDYHLCFPTLDDNMLLHGSEQSLLRIHSVFTTFFVTVTKSQPKSYDFVGEESNPYVYNSGY